jgi:hypothetical protein
LRLIGSSSGLVSSFFGSDREANMNMPDEPFALTVETAGPAAIVAVWGEVDVATAPNSTNASSDWLAVR